MSFQEVNRSPIRWAGSKRKLLPHLTRLAPRHFERYVEPFCGSLCLFVALKPQTALVGDINEELVHFYKTIKKHSITVARLAHELPDDSETYYKVRALEPTALKSQVRAARFLYLNRHCFNGVYRTNSQGKFNVARGMHGGVVPSEEELLAFGKLLRRVDVRRGDFSTLLDESGRNDFIYLDPPYAGRNIRDRGEYGAGTFKESDIERLVDLVHKASIRGAKVLISYADLPIIRSNFNDWHISKIEVDRNVSGFAYGRSRVSELIIRNFE